MSPDPSPSPDRKDLLSSQEASVVLGIKPATLYTYVSRGLLKPVRLSQQKENRYLREDVEGLRIRSSARQGHGAVAATAMRWGQPVMTTSVCEISEAGPSYRGHLATDLVRHPGVFESVAELLWTGVLPDGAHTWPVEPPHVDLTRALDGMLQDGRVKPRMMRVFSIAATALGGGSLAEELRSNSTMRFARQMLFAFAGCCGILGPQRRFAPVDGDRPLAQHILRSLQVRVTDPAEQAIQAALILGADHELSSSTFAARIAASTGATLHACVVAALAAHQGTQLAGGCDAAEDLICGLGTVAEIDQRLADAEMRRERLPGFALQIYPRGDPRASCLIELTKRIAPKSRPADLAYRFVDRARERLGIEPNIELALVVMAIAWQMPARTASALWGIGRTAGWIAHVMEQRLAGFPIRPRGQYQGLGARG
ncbi:citrate synthase family protein [Ramlibacter sp. AW1]|uniref:citrate synthase (unknown stereospecificity) n=1 Tax=Ramlibacter aurantiacus TaxID=2801330 RepID=A0A936ZJB7_9BURK|nr:citrate synthase family protein [Ramlibacter aurantiacus]MBL0421962.1 citrate synthase family protein [Ramlibacter aurantiacus]